MYGGKNIQQGENTTLRSICKQKGFLPRPCVFFLSISVSKFILDSLLLKLVFISDIDLNNCVNTQA